MATSVISGRVDDYVKEKAAAYIQAAGLTAAEVIKTVWERIARTGEVPVDESEAREAEYDPFEAFVTFCDSLEPAGDWLVNLTDEQMNDMMASRYE